jgi:hypothetical protein
MRSAVSRSLVARRSSQGAHRNHETEALFVICRTFHGGPSALLRGPAAEQCSSLQPAISQQHETEPLFIIWLSFMWPSALLRGQPVARREVLVARRECAVS